MGTGISIYENKMKCSDPLLLPAVVVDNILEFVDDDTLLTGCMVCQRWRREITQRKELWRRRCERLGAHEPGMIFPSDADFFNVYLNAMSVLRQMSTRDSWQVDDNCDGSQCVFHKELASCSERARREDWVSNIVPDIKHKERLEKKIIVCTGRGELIVLDEEKKEVTWRTEKLTTDIFTRFEDLIFTITSFGHIELYSLGGKCRVIQTGGILRGVEVVHVHPTAPLLLVWLQNNKVFLVNDEMHVFPLHLPSPQLSEQQESLESTDAEPIEFRYFETNVELSEGQLALVIQRRSSVCAVIFTTSGDILHHVFFSCDHLIKWTSLLKLGQGWNQCVYLSEGYLVAHSIHFGSSGITLQQLWRKALPARFAACPPRTVLAGRKFLLCSGGTTLQVYRMDYGTLAADFPVFLNKHNHKRDDHIAMAGFYSGSIEETVRRIYNSQTRKMQRHKAEGTEAVYVINYDWLDGLSPSTTKHDFPVAVTFSRENPRGKCLRWSEQLWAKTSLDHEQKRDQASVDIASAWAAAELCRFLWVCCLFIWLFVWLA